MSSFTLTLNAWSDRWFALFSATVVQSTVLAVLVAVVAWFLRRSSPAVRYWLWQIVAIRLLIVPFWTVSLPLPWPASEAPATQRVAVDSEVADKSTVSGNGTYPATESKNIDPDASVVLPEARATRSLAELSWQSWLMFAWLALVLLQVARLLVQRRRLSRLLAMTSPAPAALVAACNDIAARLGLLRVPEVRLSQCEGSPFVCGIWRPTLVVSKTLAAALTPVELAPVLAHELAHVKRHDLVWGWTAELARILYFFHPVAYWVGYHIRLERELACDQLALAHGGSGAADYAATLVRVLSATSQPNIFRTTMAAGLDGGERQEN